MLDFGSPSMEVNRSVPVDLDYAAPAKRQTSMRQIALALSIFFLPLLALYVAQLVYPVGGASSGLTRLAIMVLLIGVVEVVVLSPIWPRQPRWFAWSMLLILLASSVLLQVIVPSLPD